MQNMSRFIMAGAIVLVVLVIGMILATGTQIGSSVIDSRLHASVIAPDPATIQTDMPTQAPSTPADPDAPNPTPLGDTPPPGTDPSKIPDSDVPPPDVPPDQKGAAPEVSPSATEQPGTEGKPSQPPASSVPSQPAPSD